MLASKCYQSDWNTGDLPLTSPVYTNLKDCYEFAVMGKITITYATGYQYSRNDYVYARYSNLNGSKDDVNLLGFTIYRDYATPPITNGSIMDGIIYELVAENSGNILSGIVKTISPISSLNLTDTTTYKDLDNTALPNNGPWKVFFTQYRNFMTKENLDSYVKYIQNPSPETYHYQYINRGSVIKSGYLTMGSNPSPPGNPSNYQENGYNYTFLRWDLGYSGHNRIYTAIYNASQQEYMWQKRSIATSHTSLGTETVLYTNDPDYIYFDVGIHWACSVSLNNGFAQLNSPIYTPEALVPVSMRKCGQAVLVTNTSDRAHQKSGSLYAINLPGAGRTHSGKYAHIFTVKNSSRVDEEIWEVTVSKGNTLFGKVYSTDRNAYPDNGMLGDYWYVFMG